MSVGAIEAGGATVRIFANDSQFQQAMTRVQNRIQAAATTMQRMGTGMSLSGAALGAPLVMAGRQAAGFEDAILGLKARAGLASGDVAKLSDEIKRLGTEMGISPTEIAQAFLKLAEAGMSVEDIMSGAGKATVEFGRVAGVEAERAAAFMSTTMDVFKVSAQEAADTLAAAANSSPASMQQIIESFSQAASTGENFGESLFSLSHAFAVLAKAGIMGEEAGTAVKTMLTKLVSPTKDAEEALAELGLKIADFRDEAGNMLPMQQIAGIFQKAQNTLGADAFGKVLTQKSLVDVFEQRGIKVVTAFANAGVEGFSRVAEEMKKSNPVSEQFIIQMSGITGQVNRLKEGVEQMSIAFGEAIAGPLKGATDVLVGMMSVITQLIKDFPVVATAAASIATGLIAVGAAAIAASIAMRGFVAVTAALSILAGPQGWIAAAAIGAALGIVAAEAKMAADELKKAKKEVDGLGDAAKDAKPQNAVKPDEARKPMEGDPFAKKRAAEELAKEDADFEEAQGKSLEKLQSLSNSIVKEVKGLGEAAFNAGVNFQEDIREIMDKVRAEILNPNGADALAEQAKEVFEADIERVREGLKEKARDFGDSLGTFGNGAGMGIGPQLSKFIERAMVPLRGRNGGPGVQMPGGNGMADSHAPNPEWVRQQAERARRVTESAASGVSLPEAFKTSMTSVSNAVKDQIKATEAGNKILQKIADNSAKGLVFT